MTGSSGIPFQGAKYLETKWYPEPGSPLVVRISPLTSPLWSLASSRAVSGRTASSWAWVTLSCQDTDGRLNDVMVNWLSFTAEVS